MVIYLIAVTVFMIQCFIMFFIYLTEKKPPKHDSVVDSKSTVPTDEFFYFILIPCLNEGKVIQNTLQNVLRLPGRKHIFVIDDDSVDDTLIKVNSVSGPISTIKRKLPTAQTGKGDSLNTAMPMIKVYIHRHHLDPNRCIVGVIDADGVLSNNSIDKLNESFSNSRTDAVQLRVKMKAPKKILQIFQDIEFFTINHLTQMFRSYLGAVALCGNGQFFRYSSITQRLGAAPWGNALLEDYELTLRMELNGIRIHYIGNAYVDQEALLSVKKLILQRARWAQGGFNCWKYFKKIFTSRKMSPAQKFDAYFFFFQPILNLLADFSIIYLTAKFIFIHLNNPEFMSVVFIVLAVLGLFFGTMFTLIYLHQLKLHKHIGQIMKSDDMLNFRVKIKKAFLAVGLISYIYIILFFSLLISIYHELIGEQTWNKTNRI
ncbi:glycosyltransferase family 2 protein [Companilactobacillus huachuanensis]|uniref:Glycosyltransferase family 2 protein n=1 Tax=Companilactobacillus huachuanensis TaxID=2559914 RepID=A0ABW1RPD8_9LACO|nr:glycosyltransferase family 2 protein [Companilactobacillus huachuanensis]